MSVPLLRFKNEDWKEFPDWSEIELAQIGDAFSGLSGKCWDDFWTGSPYVTYKQVFDNGRIDPSKFCFVRVSKEERQTRLQYWDVLFTTSSETSDEVWMSSVMLDHPVEDTYLNSFCFWLRIRDFQTLHPEFAKYLFRTSLFRSKMITLGQWITRFNISKRKVLALGIPLPFSDEQSKIAAFLSAIDCRIASIEATLALLYSYKRGAAEKLLTQEFRFKKDNGSEFPDWQDAKFWDIAGQRKSKHDPLIPSEVLQCIELDHISQRTWQLHGCALWQWQRSLKNHFAKGDVLFGKLRPYLRKYLKAPFDGACSTEIWVLNGKKVTNDFLFHLVQSENFITVANVSSGSKMPRADWSVVSAYEIAYPCPEEQSMIADFLDSIDAKIAVTERTLETLKEYKRGLLQQMFV